MTTRRYNGFTLIELIVSIALFTVVAVIAMSAYISLISLDRRARATNDLVSNLSFVVDSMARSIRTGTGYECGGFGHGPNCTGGSSVFSFTDENGQPVTYILQTSPYKTIGECVGSSSCTNSSATPLTDAGITVTNLKFYEDGVGTTGTEKSIQPHVIFTLTGSIKPDANTAPITFTIEEMATERRIEI